MITPEAPSNDISETKIDPAIFSEALKDFSESDIIGIKKEAGHKWIVVTTLGFSMLLTAAWTPVGADGGVTKIPENGCIHDVTDATWYVNRSQLGWQNTPNVNGFEGYFYAVEDPSKKSPFPGTVVAIANGFVCQGTAVPSDYPGAYE